MASWIGVDMGHKPGAASVVTPITRPRISDTTKTELLELWEILQSHAHHDCRCREKREALDIIDAILDAT